MKKRFVWWAIIGLIALVLNFGVVYLGFSIFVSFGDVILKTEGSWITWPILVVYQTAFQIVWVPVLALLSAVVCLIDVFSVASFLRWKKAREAEEEVIPVDRLTLGTPVTLILSFLKEKYYSFAIETPEGKTLGLFAVDYTDYRFCLPNQDGPIALRISLADESFDAQILPSLYAADNVGICLQLAEIGVELVRDPTEIVHLTGKSIETFVQILGTPEYLVCEEVPSEAVFAKITLLVLVTLIKEPETEE